MEQKHQQIFDQLPKPPEGGKFRFVRVDTVSLPHPYCITPRHVTEAADHWGGRLGEEAIRAAEKKGAACEICRKSGDEILPYDKHETQLTAFIETDAPLRSSLKDIPGLHEWLLSVKDSFEAAGIQGFAFPTKTY